MNDEIFAHAGTEFVFMDNMDRGIFMMENLPKDFEIIPLVDDGDELSKFVKDLVELGAVGDVLSGVKFIPHLNIPIDPTDGFYDMEAAKLKVSILSDEQRIELKIDETEATRIGVVQNTKTGEQIFFRLPENDVAEIFPKKIETDEQRDEIAGKLIGDDIRSEEDGPLVKARMVYGLWRDAIARKNFELIDKVGQALYPDILGEATGSIDEVKTFLDIHLKHEADGPADNMWLAREAIKKVITVLPEEQQATVHTEIGTLVESIARKAVFDANDLWVVVIEPLMNAISGGDEDDAGKDKRRTFLSSLDVGCPLTSFLISDLKEYLEIVG
ncbi:TPA: hypothetical protein DIU27_04320 [Candidatus Collierbacteria bacterium]|uniref:Uncharacterized protein n=1 Tax=Candidatus Collierbacteria bacterium GW2011_GWB2_44_22 TaxID=1618387 RepID=A0A0G1K5X3_9BACT|nr:MAG: hypothetical protein UW31_C0013G0016 [Candidatus Collierbacteria bacterium GW2011_GWA2_44_13]KKT49114.1 MAG: hypothetical protein UW42_C0040G0003 [Candidatus Collierbacteria bacterium GW2011_GWB1_44_197]KKT51697.1 MAG: hypothetical protein UW44_C0008G0019 [Candidatus Collierbacteria bacterium GW2011_GWB2_44_22]KKT62494.1 MAG: hypothetical protein UW56_C0006G0017 [Candidatus Collierbacteria bacterium GW2011_GWD1_44_27]KKT66916.1 MAG: hypothetical protein UW58_C0001G0020 [Candidatus Colli